MHEAHIPRDVITIEPSKAPIDRQAVVNEVMSIADIADRIELYCIPTAIDSLFPTAESKQSSELYVVDAVDYLTDSVKTRLDGVYPDSYIIRKESMEHEPRPDPSGGPLYTVEYKSIGSHWTEDTLMPLAPAVDTPETRKLRIKDSSPLVQLIELLQQSECVGLYHTTIRTGTLSRSRSNSSAMIESIAERYDGGRSTAGERARNTLQKIFTDDDDEDSTTTEGVQRQTPTHTSYADDLRAIKQASFAEIDPRAILYGPDAKAIANDISNCFHSLNVSACNIEGTVCAQRRARQGYARAFEPTVMSIRGALRSKLRAPQWRVPGFKQLTRNQSSRFFVSEYALPHFISMEATTAGATGGSTINRRPATAPPEPSNQLTTHGQSS